MLPPLVPPPHFWGIGCCFLRLTLGSLLRWVRSKRTKHAEQPEWELLECSPYHPVDAASSPTLVGSLHPLIEEAWRVPALLGLVQSPIM